MMRRDEMSGANPPSQSRVAGRVIRVVAGLAVGLALVEVAFSVRDHGAASLAVAEPGGDPCKGWAIPKYCDVRGVRVPKERRWRSDPPCIEVEGTRK